MAALERAETLDECASEVERIVEEMKKNMPTSFEYTAARLAESFRARNHCLPAFYRRKLHAKYVSDYMRALQLRAAQARWSGLSAAERSERMKKVRMGKQK